MITYYKESSCRCCGSDNLFTYLDLGNQPLANNYHTGGKPQQRFPLEVNLCQGCFHSQLSIVVNPKLLFNEYIYVSGTTKTLHSHFSRLVYSYREHINGGKVLDIACNDGTLLSICKNAGAKVYGVDPAKNLRPLTEEKGIPVITDYWGNFSAKKSVEDEFGKDFDFIVATNVFAHVANPISFLVDAKSILSDDGLLVLEFPYAKELLNNVEFDTIYHEHLSYFLVKSFQEIAYRAGLIIVDIEKINIHGGSIRFTLKKRGNKTNKAATFISNEYINGLYNKQNYIDFALKVLRNKIEFREWFYEEKKKGKKIIGYGAAAKGNTLLNHYNMPLDYIVDDNILKQDLLTPGMNIPIKSPEVLALEEDINLIVLSWNFYDEIRQRVSNIRGSKNTTFVRCIPRLRLD